MEASNNGNGDDRENPDENGPTAEQQRAASPLDVVVEPTYDPAFMVLAQGYRLLGIQIKTATLEAADRLGIPRVEQISDFEYAQFAIFFSMNSRKLFDRFGLTLPVEEEIMEDMVNRIAALQFFRFEYGIRDETVEKGVDAIRALMELEPNLILHIANDFGNHDSASRGCILILDGVACDWKIASTNWETYIVGMYYLNQALFPHFAAMLRGTLQIIEAEGMGRWDHLLEFKNVFQRHNEELKQFFPGTVKGLQIYHAPSLVRTVYSVCKRFMAPHLVERYQLDLSMDPALRSRYDRLSDLFAMNTTDVILNNVTEMLDERQANVDQYTL